MASAIASEVGGTTSSASDSTSSDQSCGPSTETTALPDASDAASVP
jgi:hypothetical protein